MRIETPAELAAELGAPLSELARLSAAGAYVTRWIAKPGGGARRIDEPAPGLKAIQRRILDGILSALVTHPAAHGFEVGRSVVTNAAPHARARLVLKADLADFFPSVGFARVVRVLAPVCSPSVAHLVAGLCCTTSGPRVLPQGAPTSPRLANLVAAELDAALVELSAARGATFTRYADDLTFSFSDRLPLVDPFFAAVEGAIVAHGFQERRAKRQCLSPHQRQIVTGIVVNAGLAAPREQRRRVRAALHQSGGARLSPADEGARAWVAMVAAGRQPAGASGLPPGAQAGASAAQEHEQEPTHTGSDARRAPTVAVEGQ